VFAYVIEGQGYFGLQTEKSEDSGQDLEASDMISNETLVLYSDGDQVVVSTRKDAVRFLLISGKPIREPVAWQGPIVMNTQEELRLAFEEYQAGTFIK